MGGFPSAWSSPTRHSRARGKLGLVSAELTWIPAFAGMTEASGSWTPDGPRVNRVLRSTDHPRTGIFEGGTKNTKFGVFIVKPFVVNQPFLLRTITTFTHAPFHQPVSETIREACTRRRDTAGDNL